MLQNTSIKLEFQFKILLSMTAFRNSNTPIEQQTKLGGQMNQDVDQNYFT